MTRNNQETGLSREAKVALAEDGYCGFRFGILGWAYKDSEGRWWALPLDEEAALKKAGLLVPWDEDE